MTYLSFKDMEIVSWGLLLIPVVVLITCYILGRSSSTSAPNVPVNPIAPTPAAPTMPVSCQASTIATPAAMSAASSLISSNNLCSTS